MYKVLVFFFKQKTAYEMRISDLSSDVCSSDLLACEGDMLLGGHALFPRHGPERIGLLHFEARHRAESCIDQAALQRAQREAAFVRHVVIALGNEAALTVDQEIGRASCREGVCQYV